MPNENVKIYCDVACDCRNTLFELVSASDINGLHRYEEDSIRHWIDQNGKHYFFFGRSVSPDGPPPVLDQLNPTVAAYLLEAGDNKKTVIITTNGDVELYKCALQSLGFDYDQLGIEVMSKSTLSHSTTTGNGIIDVVIDDEDPLIYLSRSQFIQWKNPRDLAAAPKAKPEVPPVPL